MKTRMRAILAAGLLMVLGTTAANAVPIIDQDQSSGPAYMAAFAQTDLAQSFQQANGNIVGAGIFLQAGVGTSDNVTISLWDALPNAGGSLLATGSAMGTAGSWVDVFWGSVLVVPDTTLYLVFTGNTTLGIAGDTNDPYSRGQVYANPGYQAFSNFDYTFRTYYDDETVDTPEPTTLALLGLGLVGMGLRRRKIA